MTTAERIETGRVTAGYPPEMGELQYKNIPQLLRQTERFANRPALTSLGRTLSYR